MSSRGPASAAIANPLPIALPNVVRSGRTPYTAAAPAVDQRKPVIISSNTSSAPSAVHSSRRPSRNPGAGSFAVAGSRIRQATWPGCSANRRRTDSRSLYRKPTVRSRIDCGMPAGIGVWPMNQSSVEKNGWSSQIAIRSRPVAARASFTAAVVTSEPLRANLTMSQPMVSRNRSAAVTSIAVGRTKLPPWSRTARTASLTRGWAWPSDTARSPEPYSTYSLPSTSQTWLPRPRAMIGARPSGYWSSPLA